MHYVKPQSRRGFLDSDWERISKQVEQVQARKEFIKAKVIVSKLNSVRKNGPFICAAR